MTDIPIIFSGSMIRALLEGHKSMTRRLALRKCPGRIGEPCARCNDTGFVASPWQKVRPCDRLYVREAWAVKRHEPCLDHERDWQDLHSPTVRYLADGAERKFHGDRKTGAGIYHGQVEKGKPSIHMPRWASRLTLTVTAARIERLQDISGDDAILEGISLADHKCGCERCSQTSQLCPATASSLCMAFADLWRSLHGPDAWQANPEVIAISFTVEHRNIDACLRTLEPTVQVMGNREG